MPQYVFINGERMELLEDRRFSMYPRFPEGTELFDPSTTPSRPVPLSQENEDLGVTTRKLVPNRHYFARNVDGTPANAQLKYLIVHNVPAQITARDLGQFFENYSQVVEADILRWPHGNASPQFSKGRAYVALQDMHAMSLLAKERSVYFDPMDTFLFIEGTDRHPAQINYNNTHFQPPPLPPPTYDQGQASSIPPPAPRGAAPPALQQPPLSSGRAALPPVTGGLLHPPGGQYNRYEHRQQPPNSNNSSSNNAGNNNNSSGGDVSNTYYFVDKVPEEYANYSHHHGVFWPSPANRKEYLQAASKGTVYVCILLIGARGEPHLYGYTKVQWPQPANEGTRQRGEVAVEWVSFGTMLDKSTLQQRLMVNVCGMSEGTPLKPELGQSIADLVDTAPQTAKLPRGHDTPPPIRQDEFHHHPGGGNPNFVPRGGAGHHHGGNQGFHPMHGKKGMPPPPGGVSGAPLHHHGPQQKRGGGGGPPPPRNFNHNNNTSNYSGPSHSAGGGGGAGGSAPAVPLPASVARAQAAAAAAAAAKAAEEAKANGKEQQAGSSAPPQQQQQPKQKQPKQPKEPHQKQQQQQTQQPKPEPKEDYPALPDM